MSNQTTLRDVEKSDVEIFYQQQLIQKANFMAAFTAKDPSDEHTFLNRWQKILADENVYAQTIMLGKKVVGNISHHGCFGEPEVSYWIDEYFWGKGIVTEALRQFLEKVNIRPLYARVAEASIGSKRVLEKGEFVYLNKEKSFAEAHGHDIKELIYIFR